MSDEEAKPEETASDTQAPAPKRAKCKRGFASMDPALVRELARRGGKSSQGSGRGHQFTTEEARVAGSKGGFATQKRYRERKTEPEKGSQGE